jgi:hypothetical protein
MYLCDLIPPTIQSTTVYPLRNGSHIITPFCRLWNTYDSFIPSTIRQWNSLDPSIRNVDSIAKLTTRNLSDLFIYSNTCLTIISFCSYESVGLPQVKSVRSKAQ